MNYKDLKIFCDSLTEEQLSQEVYLSITDGEAPKVTDARVSQQDEWFDHCDSMGYEEDMINEFGENWKEHAEDYTKVPKGTVLLISNLY